MKESTRLSLFKKMICTAILAAIAAFSIHHLVRSKIVFNESSAISNLRKINEAQTAYHSVHAKYAESFADLAPAFLEGDWSGSKSGYRYFMVGDGGASYSCTANRFSPITATRSFFTDETGVLRAASADTATVANDPLDCCLDELVD